MERNQENPKRCPFFNVCAAYIIREKIKDNQSFEILVRKKVVLNLPKWSEQFCSADFKNCVHFQERNKVSVSAVKGRKNPN